MQLALHWLPILNGYLAIAHRPARKAFSSLKEQGCTWLVTLLSEKEGADALRADAEREGIQWLWLPLANAQPPQPEREQEILESLKLIVSLLDNGNRVLIHCSAGIHRTGMIAYALLRHVGVPRDAARSALKQMRAETAENVGEVRLAWGDRFAKEG